MKKIIFILCFLFPMLLFGQGETDSPYDVDGWDDPADSSKYYDLYIYELLSNPGGYINRNTRAVDSLFNELIVYTDSTQLIIEDDTLKFASEFINNILDSTFVADFTVGTCLSLVDGTITIDMNCLSDSLWTSRHQDSVITLVESRINDSLRVYHPNLAYGSISKALANVKSSGTTVIDFDTTDIGYLFPQNDTSEKLAFAITLPTDYKEGTDIYPHITWRQSASSSVGWKLDYILAKTGEGYTGTSSTLTVTTLEDAIAYPGTGSTVQVSALQVVSGTGLEVEDVILFTLYRDDNTTVGDVLAWEVGFQYYKSDGGKSGAL